MGKCCWYHLWPDERICAQSSNNEKKNLEISDYLSENDITITDKILVTI